MASWTGLLIIIVFSTHAIEAITFEEKSITCNVYSEDHDMYLIRNVDSLFLCDGEQDCHNGEDEDSRVCDTDLPRFELTVEDSGNTWAELSWKRDYCCHGRTPTGSLLTWRQGDNVLSVKLRYSNQRSYFVENLLPATNYTVILRSYAYDRYYHRYYVGGPRAATLRTDKTGVPVQTAPDRFKELSIHCQDPLSPETNISVATNSLCDEVQDCFQGADEMKQLCGNIHHVRLSVTNRTTKSVILKWSVQGEGSPWGTPIEEQRTSIYGKRRPPDGFFVTTVTDMKVVTPAIEVLAGRRFVITNLNSSTNYTFLVRPYINTTGSREGYKIGKLLSLSEVTDTNGLQNLTSFPVDESNAVVIWSAELDGDVFRVNYENSVGPVSTKMRRLPDTTVDGKRNKVFSMFVPNMKVSTNLTGVACGNHGCSQETTITIDQLRQENPVVKILSAQATSPTSFYVYWTMNNKNFTLTDGYWVRFCEESETLCRLRQTSDKSLTVTGLRPATKYTIRIQPRIKARSGNIELGAAATTQIWTWTAVPDRPELVGYHVIRPPCQLHVDWTFYGSTVSHIQISLANETWVNCTTREHCNAHVVDNEVESSTTHGSLILWNLEYYRIYQLLLRGCNDNGCGANNFIVFSTPIDASSPPINLRAEPYENGTLVKWERPVDPRGPLEGYDVSWTCAEETRIADGVTREEFLITEPLYGENCTVSVSAYHTTEEGRLLRGAEACVPIDVPLMKSVEYPNL